MKTNPRIVWLIFLFAVSLALPVRQVNAYLDPGTGSYILQLVVAGIAGALISIKVFWRNIKMFFVSIFYKSKQDNLIEKDDDKN